MGVTPPEISCVTRASLPSPVFGVFTDIVSGETSTIGNLALVHVLVFVVVLFFGLVAVWAKGDLDWVMTYKAREWEPTRPRRLPLARTVADLEEEQSESEDHGGEDTDDGTTGEGAEAPATA